MFVGWTLAWIWEHWNCEVLAMLVIWDVCWMNFGLNFGGIEVMKNLLCRLGWTKIMMNVEDLLACIIYGKILWVWVWKILRVRKNFCGYGILATKIFLLGMWCWIMKKFCGYDFGYLGIFVVVHWHGHVGIFSMAWLGKNLVLV